MSHINRSLRRKGAIFGLSAAALFAGVTTIAPAANAMSASVAGSNVNVDTSDLGVNADNVMGTVSGAVNGLPNVTVPAVDLPAVSVPSIGGVDTAGMINGAVATAGDIANNTGITL